MHLKFDTIQGWLIYTSMLAYLLAFISLLFKSKKIGWVCYTVGFVLAPVPFVYPWYHVGHIPLQHLFEVFLCLGMLIYPLSVFCRRFLDISSEATDALIGFVILFPAGFVFNAEPQKLPPALQSWLFAPHVAAYMFSYIIMAKAGVPARYLDCALDARSGGNEFFRLKTNLERAHKISERWADSFPDSEAGLLFTGPPGVGKKIGRAHV